MRREKRLVFFVSSEQSDPLPTFRPRDDYVLDDCRNVGVELLFLRKPGEEDRTCFGAFEVDTSGLSDRLRVIFRDINACP